MNGTIKILKYEFQNILRSKWIIAYGLFFLLLTEGLFQFIGQADKVILSLMNLTLAVIPLVSIIFGAMYLYNAREFVELLLAQPINRKKIYWGMYTGIGLTLSVGFLLGVGLPFLFHGVTNSAHWATLAMMLFSGVALTLIFTALAFLISVKYEDKIKGLGFAIMLWLIFSVLYDGALLLIVYLFEDYPLDGIILGMSLANPVDLARIVLMLQFDISAMMGYTGALFNKFFGSSLGMMISVASLMIWMVIPFFSGLRMFRKKDF